MKHRILAAISAIALVATAPGCCRDNVVTIDMRDYGLSAATPGNAAEKIIAAFDYCKSLGRPARIVLEKGTYDIRFDSGSIENPVLLTIDSMKDFTFDGGGSMLYFHGLTGLAGIINSENISLENFSMNWRRPYITQAEVVEMSPDHIDLKIDAAEYPYRIDGDRVKYVCDDGEYDVVEDSYCNYLTPEGKIVPGTSDDYQLYKVLNGPVERLHDGILRFKGKIASSAPAGSRLLIYHVRYKTPWCYCYLTRDITLKDIVIHHCTGCGMISDCCDGILLDNVDYTPSGDRLFTGIADAFHVTHASGLVEMRNCDVDGQGDDAINIHGRYHRMTPAKDDGRTFRCIARSDVPLVYPGDSVWIVNSADMKRSEKYAVEDFTMLGEETFEMVLASPVPETAPDVVLYAENSERNPEVHIHDNRFGSGNRARGVLLTTPRKSVIENNVFESSGAAILIEGDISYWYESGGVTDVRISDNVFYHCATSPWGAAVITLTPSTDIPGYHSGVIISGNRFVMAPGVLPLYTVDSTAVNFLPDNIME